MFIIIENKDRDSYYKSLEESDRRRERAFVRFVFDNLTGQLKRMGAV